jgi:hypothetical protein
MSEQQRRYLEERWQALIDRNTKKPGESVTWDGCIRYIDETLEELAIRLNGDPLHGVLWQQCMAVMMLRRQQVITFKHREESKG